MRELKGDLAKPAEGFVLEAHRDAKRGLAATLIITDGTLRSGMAVLAGRAIAPVRIMETTAGKSLREANFSSPVRIVGFDTLPEAGTSFRAYKNKKEAEGARPAPTRPAAGVPQARSDSETEHFAMPVIVRADAAGSLEAIEHELSRLQDEHSSVRIVQSGLGAISEGDVKTALAGTTPAVVIGFNVGTDPVAEEYARQHGIRIETFNIIYKLTEHVEELRESTRPRRTVEEVVGRAKVLKQFSSRKDMHVIGGSVSEGYLARGGAVRVLRRGTVIGVGKFKNIQSHKADVARVETGSEFGAQIESPFEITQGDTLECFTSSQK
jgi:translation initiation factor IF-2